MTRPANEPASESAISASMAQVSKQRLAELCLDMVSIPSPTGRERDLAEQLVVEMDDIGLVAESQEVDGDLVNAIGRLEGSGGGPSLLLYAPIDTVTTGDAEADVPWVGPELRPDMEPVGEQRGDVVIGLGAQNPKGHGACVLMAAEAIQRAGVELAGDVILGFGGGGMPSNRWRPDLPDGHGQGVPPWWPRPGPIRL